MTIPDTQSMNEVWISYEDEVLSQLWKQMKVHPSSDPVAEVLREFFEATFYGGAAACLRLKKNGVADIHLEHQLVERVKQGAREYPVGGRKGGR